MADTVRISCHQIRNVSQVARWCTNCRGCLLSYRSICCIPGSRRWTKNSWLRCYPICHCRNLDGAVSPHCGSEDYKAWNANSGSSVMRHQLNDSLNSKGERLVFVLNNLLNDCGCSKPNS